MDIKLIIFSLAGGLALFLFGMKILSNGLQMAFGDRLSGMLEKVTGNKWGGVAMGAGVTAIIQSSSITTVTLVGLINAGIITLSQSIPVIMGANIGTTVTAQLIAFKVGKFALPIIAIGFLLQTIGKKDVHKYIGQVILGFGILFLGMNLMSSESDQLTRSQSAMSLLAEMGKVPILGILAGTVFTGIIQSSSATSGLVISMGMGDSPLITLKAAIALILGANIGTCVTALIASIGSTLSSRRAALAHILFNVFGVFLLGFFISPFADIIKSTSSDLTRQIANAHLTFNIVTTLVLLPLCGVLETIVKRILPGEEVKVEKGTKYLDEHTLHTPAVAISLAQMETVRMGRVAISMLEHSRVALCDFDLTDKNVEMVKEKEKLVDELDDKIEVFISKIEKDILSSRQLAELAIMNHAISDLERIGDHANNICELAERRAKHKVRFSEDAFSEMETIFDMAIQSIVLCIDVITRGDSQKINMIMEIEMEVDRLVKNIENNHYERLEQGICSAEAGPIYLDILRNLERITDHTHNIAYAKNFGF